MKLALILLGIWGSGLLAQIEELYSTPTPEVPPLELDLNRDGHPEFRSEVYTIGTDDVPSSSGSHIYQLTAGVHVEMLCPNNQIYESYTPIWTDAAFSAPPQGAYHWVRGCGLEMAWTGYGNGAQAGWESYQREVRQGKRVWVRFQADEQVWVGWLSLEFTPGTLHLQRLGHEVWREN